MVALLDRKGYLDRVLGDVATRAGSRAAGVDDARDRLGAAERRLPYAVCNAPTVNAFWLTYETRNRAPDAIYRRDLLDGIPFYHFDGALSGPISGRLRWYAGAEDRLRHTFVDAGLRYDPCALASGEDSLSSSRRPCGRRRRRVGGALAPLAAAAPAACRALPASQRGRFARLARRTRGPRRP